MHFPSWTPDDIRHRKLAGAPSAGFDCGRVEQNEFLYRRAWLDQQESVSTTYLFFVGRRWAAYATFLMDSIPLSRKERGKIPYRTVGAVKLGQLGVDQRFQGGGLGTEIVVFGMSLAKSVGRRLACRYLTLDAQPDLVGWYEARGFVRNHLRQAERLEDALRHGRDPAHTPVSMRFDLRAV
jgi:GNAT superfamily N-acetyltransferase